MQEYSNMYMETNVENIEVYMYLIIFIKKTTEIEKLI